MALSLLDSLCEMVDFVREHGGEERPRLRQAVKRVEVKIGVLRKKKEAHARRRCCPICRTNCSGIVCFHCWPAVPMELRAGMESAKTEEATRAVAREILTWARSSQEREAA